jgi:hypothetical protein
MGARYKRADCFANDRPAWLLPEPTAQEPNTDYAKRCQYVDCRDH